MLKIVSVIDCAMPAARSAANDEPYSTMRRSSRCHHTRCGMRCTSGPAPVAIDDRHTGVSDGNTEVAREYERLDREYRAVNRELEGVRNLPAETKDGAHRIQPPGWPDLRFTLHSRFSLPGHRSHKRRTGDETSFLGNRGRHGVGLHGIAAFHASGQGPDGLLFGYAGMDVDDINTAMSTLVSELGSQ